MLNSKKLFILALSITAASIRADIDQTPEEISLTFQEEVEQPITESQNPIDIAIEKAVVLQQNESEEENTSDMQNLTIVPEEQALSTIQIIAEKLETEEQSSSIKVTSLAALLALAQQAQKSDNSIQINGQSYELEISSLDDHGTQFATNDHIDHASGK